MNKILCLALIIVMLLSAATTFGQPDRENKNINPRTFSIAVSPLTLLEFEPTVNLQLVYKFSNKHSTAIEVGRIIKPLGKKEDSDNPISHEYTGWRFRPEIRFWNKPSKMNYWRNSYLAIEGLIKTAEEQLYYTVQRRTPSGLPYIEAVEQNIHKTVLGLNGLVGKETDLLNSRKIFTDLFTGFGLRYKFFKDNIGTNFSKTPNGDFTNTNGFYPTVALGIRIGYRTN